MHASLVLRFHIQELLVSQIDPQKGNTAYCKSRVVTKMAYEI